MAVNEFTTTQTLLKKLKLPNLVRENRCDLEDYSDSASGPLLTPMSGAMAGHKVSLYHLTVLILLSNSVR